MDMTRAQIRERQKRNLTRVKKDAQLPTVRLPSDDLKAVRAFAKQRKCLVTDIIREAVIEFIASEQAA